MTMNSHSDSSLPSVLELANPKFRFPVKANLSAASIADENSELREIRLPSAFGHEASQTIVHSPHPGKTSAHHLPNQAERYIGWSIQDVSWVASLTVDPQVSEPQSTPESPAAQETVLPSISAAEKLSVESAATAESNSEQFSDTAARPLDLNSVHEASADVATHWSTSSRAQVTGFAMLRTKFPQPQTIVSGSGLASGHRRWAARNHSAEIQARTISLHLSELSGSQVESRKCDSATIPAERVPTDQAGTLSGGLPFVVHPDFHWSPVVEHLAKGGPFAEQLLAAAVQLLHQGQGRLLFASTKRQQGATTLAAAISRLLIDRGHRVLMVDADLSRAGWTSNLDLLSAGSWVQQVAAFEPLQAAMAISRLTNSAFVGLHPVVGRRDLPPYLLDYLGQLLVPIKAQFDATIIDVGPVSQLLDELSQPTRLGTSVMVVQQGGADAALELRRNKTTLNAFGISRLAIARNFAA